MAGSLKRGYPDVDEDLTLIRALVDSNVPKFLADDLPLFAAIVKVRGDRERYICFYLAGSELQNFLCSSRYSPWHGTSLKRLEETASQHQQYDWICRDLIRNQCTLPDNSTLVAPVSLS